MRFLPRRLAHQGAMRGPLESFEVSADLAFGGMIPATADDLHRAEVAEHAGGDGNGRAEPASDVPGAASGHD
jgi:hypothetical protein